MSASTLSSVRRAILVSCLLALAFVATYVPWRVPTVKSWIYFPRGYHWVWSPPVANPSKFGVVVAPSIDLSRVGLEILTVAALGGAAFVLAGAANKPR